MSTVTDTVTIEGIDMQGSPPCEVRKVIGDAPCPNPAAYRVILPPCAACRDYGRIFICRPCLDLIRPAGAYCRRCLPAFTVRQLGRFT